ncbi:gliding motility lipoprotein GldH [Galbibacter sp.]|uniref:gliding motility lipoprotein GldH n=1 Tax=Galbibacter sp. TaxID=2918471 RepID=UPI002CEA4CD6|nr:gliding motility lipoprotein GldH [Galbibacter sp.]HLV63154.1 gliding motility lipoprotein GldH [Galbibacter sp.]
MLNRFAALWLIMILLSSCNNANMVYGDYKELSDGWDKGQSVVFEFPAPDSTQTYDVFINLRNNEDYPFSNLFLIVNMNFPNGKVVADTLQYEMAKASGEWLGQGFSSLKENKLFYKEHIVFPELGSYQIAIQHAMRKNGDVEGVTTLEGITDVGIRIEKSVK